MTLPRLAEKKRLGEPIVMVTAYDYPSAPGRRGGRRRCRARRRLGRDDRARLPVDRRRLHRGDAHARARRAARVCAAPLLVGDLPFGSYEASDEQAIATAQRFIKEAGCRRRQARARRHERRASPCDRRVRDPRDGPRRSHAADGHGARRIRAQGRTERRRPGSPVRRSRSRRRAASQSCSRRSRLR